MHAVPAKSAISDYRDDHTKLPLRTWLTVAWMMTENSAGASATAVQRALGVSYGAAWHLLHKLRSVMAHEASAALGRAVEVEHSHTTLPRVRRVASALDRWLLETHQRTIADEHLPFYLDEFVFRIDHGSGGSPGELFHELMTRALAGEPVRRLDVIGGRP